jgi:hypothetical protein
MATQLTGELLQLCEAAEESEPQREIPVIVTLSDWGRRSEVEARGMRVVHWFERISAVAGMVTAAQARAIAALAPVESIDLDGQVSIA